MNHPIALLSNRQLPGRVLAAVALALVAVAALYRAWLDIATIGYEDPEQSQIVLALPVFALLLMLRRDLLARVPLRSSLPGLLTAAAGWGLSWYGYANAVQSLWHLGAVLTVIGAAWSVLGDRAMWVALPAVLALFALVPVPNLLRQDIALPLQRITAIGAEFVLVALGLGVERVGQTLFYNDKPVTIEEACNGMRMVFALLLVCYCFVMVYRLNAFARLMLIAVSPLLAVLCNIIRVVPTVVIYGEMGQETGDLFHDLSGWAMILLAALLLLGLIRALIWADVPIFAPIKPPKRIPMSEQVPGPALFATGVPLATLFLLLAVALHSLMQPGAADARPYHAAVVTASDNTPLQVDNLQAKPMEIPEGSLKLLRPNTARAAQYTSPDQHISAQFLLIQSKDARDLSGHYPPRCYPNVYGYVQLDSKPRQWQIDGLTLQGTEYTFAESSLTNAPRWVVMHFFALPGGGTTGKLSQMQHAAADYLRRYQGAAQIQMVFADSVPQPDRDAMFVQVMNAHQPLLKAILDLPGNTSAAD